MSVWSDFGTALGGIIAQNNVTGSAIGSVVASTIGTTSTVSAAATSTPSGSTRATRQAQMQSFTGWDNNPDVRALQEKSWQIYVDTGSWGGAEQAELHKQAEDIRKYNNPTYTGSTAGPATWQDAEQITPRDTTPNADTAEGALDSALNSSNWGSYAKIGLLALLGFMVLSLFRGR